MPGEALFIGQVAKKAGVTSKTIRYYETVGLLSPPPRGANRYRIYRQEVVQLLLFIKKAQRAGFTLAEIKEIVDLHRCGQEPCAHVQTLLHRKIADLDQQLKDLVALRKKLRALAAEFTARVQRNRITAVVCPRIEAA